MRLLTIALLLLSTLAYSQDEWTTFPPSPGTPPAKQPPPGTAPATAPTTTAPKKTTPPASAAPAPSTSAPASTATPAPATTTGTGPRLSPEEAAAARARAEDRLRKAEGKPPLNAPAASTDDTKVVSTQERYVPGSEPHSPATWGNEYNAKANTRIAPGIHGIGLLHVRSANLGPKGIVRFWADGEYMNQKNFPVLQAQNIRTAGTFGASFVTPLEWLEAHLDYAAQANTNSTSSPTLIQALGDITFGLTGAKEWTKGLYAGGAVDLTSFSGVGNQGLDRVALGFGPKLVGTYDLREPFPAVPLRVHLNAGFMFDGTGKLVTAHVLNASEEYALGVNRYNRFVLGAALEAPLPAVTPFIEYNGAYAMKGGGNLVGPDGRPVTLAEANAQTFGLGVKITAIKDLTLFAAADLGLSRKVGLGIPATPPFNFLFGASFNIDPYQRGEARIVETVRERKVKEEVAKPPVTGKVEGTVVDATTKKPIPGVIVAMAGSGSGMPPVATDVQSGRFLTYDVPGGNLKLTASKDGYKDAALELLLEPGKTQSVQIPLEPEAKKAELTLNVTTNGKKTPVAAKVDIKGPTTQSVNTAANAAGPTKVDVPAGQYVVNVTADKFLAQTREIQVNDGGKMTLDFDLTAEPAKKLVIVKENKIEILQQVHFLTGQATILADSFLLLNQVVDAIVKNDIKRVRVEGHTDNKGGKAYNQKLSEDRAASVAAYLVAQGIDKSRIESAGFGDTRPVAPNLTARGRELNRRVEFVILEK